MSGVAPEAIVLSLLLGVLLGLVFAAVEALRALLSLGRIATAVLDLLFALLAAVSTFILALAAAKGSLRFFSLSALDGCFFRRKIFPTCFRRLQSRCDRRRSLAARRGRSRRTACVSDRSTHKNPTISHAA